MVLASAMPLLCSTLVIKVIVINWSMKLFKGHRNAFLVPGRATPRGQAAGTPGGHIRLREALAGDGSHNLQGQESTPLPPAALGSCSTLSGALRAAFAMQTSSVLGGLMLGPCLKPPAVVPQAGKWGTETVAGGGRGLDKVSTVAAAGGASAGQKGCSKPTVWLGGRDRKGRQEQQPEQR